MSVIETNGTGYAEKELIHNWAAEYARREIEQLRSKTDEALLKKKDLDEANQEHDELKEKLTTGLDGKADKTQYASIDQAGLIKLYSSGGTNRSGLYVGTDGTTYVACSASGGITRDGAGGLKIMDGGVKNAMLANGSVTSGKLDKSLQTFKVTTDGNLMIPDGFSKSIAYSSVKVNKILGQALHDSDAIHHSLYDHAPSVSESGATGDLWFVGDERAVDEIYICGGIMPGEELQPGELGIQIDYFYWYKIYPITDTEVPTIYSTTPQRVGTWIDGTPVWRVAFDQDLTDTDRQQKYVDITANLPIIDRNKAFILNETATLYQGIPCMIDDRTLDSHNRNDVKGAWDISAISNLQSFDGIYGWVEFGTQESNIRA